MDSIASDDVDLEDALQAPAAELCAWRQAYRIAIEHERVPVTVWRSRGEYLVLRQGETPPARARSLGTILAPFQDPVRFRIYYADGRPSEDRRLPCAR